MNKYLDQAFNFRPGDNIKTMNMCYAISHINCQAMQ